MAERSNSTETEATMMSREALDVFRRMSPSERLKVTLEMIHENTPRLFAGTDELVARRFELLRRQNDERNWNMLTAIARTR